MPSVSLESINRRRRSVMSSGGFVEEMMREQSLLEATCGDLFDHIEDLLDFSKEESAADVLLLDAPAPGSPLAARIIDVGARTGAPPSAAAGETLMAVPPPHAQDDGAAFFGGPKDGGHIGSCDDLDMAQLEWLSGLFDDTSIPHELAFPALKTSALAATPMLPPEKLDDATVFRSSSPISVLEHNNNSSSYHTAAATNKNNNVGSASSSSSSSSSSSAWSAPVSPRQEPPPPPLVIPIPARARSKRSRPSAFSGGRAVEPPTILVPTPMYSAATSSHSDPESIAESDPNPAPPKKKKKKAKKPAEPVPAASDAEGDADGDADYVVEGGERSQPQGGGAVRRCTHCLIEKTPQWRAGPLGPKTLCNACGVRYKSGRLFPEYRPAASPTFVPSIHSNSHKKVVEMRQKAVRSGDPSCDLLQLIRRRD